MPILFLDTHIWNYLVDSDKYSDEQRQQARERLIEGVKNGEWEVVCSLPVLQEILRVHRNDPEKYEAIKDLFFAAVAHRWLIELKERYVAEVRNGGRLSPHGIYLDREKRRKILRLANNKKDVTEGGDIIYKEGLGFKAQQEDAKQKVYKDLGSADGKAPKKITQTYEKWFANDRDLPGWVHKVLEGGVTRKLYTVSLIEGLTPTYSNGPSLWRYVDFRQAKVLQNLGLQIAIKESDGVDADTYGCSPYYNILVTDDQKFVEAINLVVDGRSEVQSFEQFMEMLGV